MGKMILNGKEYAGGGSEWHEYSTNEKVVGKWIDGKPLYEKTILLSNSDIPHYDLKYISHNISNLGKVIQIQGILYIYDGGYTFLPRVQDNSTTANIGIDITPTSVLLKGRGNDFDTIFLGGHITFQYTKTTD